MEIEDLKELQSILKDLIKAQKDLDKSSETRYVLGINATRSRITTANARLSTNAEQRGRVKNRFIDKFNLIF